MQHKLECQDEAIAFLSDPATHGGAPVERVDTHISHLFLAGDRVYKLKRSVRTNFLDFTTPDLREAACRREIDVNHDTSQQIYLGVLPIVRRDGGLALGGAGEPVDWVVEMRRFDRETELDRLAERGALTTDLAEALADAVAEMHCAAPRTPEFGGAERVGATIEQITAAIRDAPGKGPAPERLELWHQLARVRLRSVASQLDARQRHGRVRRCHGDLHLGNICLIDGRPTPFDALEFNEEMASTDVLYDIAFTVMDLSERGLPAQASAFLNRYLAATRDYSGASLLALFVSMRAAVRALVAASRKTPNPHEPSAAERLDFAIASLEAGPEPQLIAIGGLSGSGKSTIARRIAPEIGSGAGAIVIRSDVARKHVFGVAPEDRLPDSAYLPAVSARLYCQMLRDAGRALRGGASVVLDATYLAPNDRDRVAALARRLGLRFTGLWLDCTQEVLRARVTARHGDASDADLAVVNAQLDRDPGAGDWISVPADGEIETTARAARAALAR